MSGEAKSCRERKAGQAPKKPRIGIFGGAFDPPHNGHIAAAEAFWQQANLDELVIMPSFATPKKASAEDPAKRLQMLQIAFSEPQYTVSDYELKQGGICYTADTLRYFASEGVTPVFLVGSDSFLRMDGWVRAGEIFAAAEIAYVMRGGDDADAIAAKCRAYESRYGAVLTAIHADPIEVSSGDLRRMLKDGDKDALTPQTIPQAIPSAVRDYIEEQGMYGTSKGRK